MGRRRLLVGAVLALLPLAGCAHIAPPQPRFVAVFEQRSPFCRIQVLHDTRSAACFVAFRCARQPVSVVKVDPEVCVP
jgi:hypothetical protein